MDLLHKLPFLMQEEPLFWFTAITGTVMLLVQLLMTSFGIGFHDQAESSDMDAAEFKWMSKQALTGFVMMFGWAGLTCRYEFGLFMVPALFISCLCGVASFFATGLIFKLTRKLHSSGTVFKIDEAVGKEATVYQRIPKGGMGKVSLSLHNFTHEIDAISHNDEEISSFTPVQILKKADNKTLVVEVK